MIFGDIHRAGSVRQKACSRAYTVVEVLVAVCVLAIMIISLYGGFSAGFAVVQVARENMRATQIMVQKIEMMRLFNWDQITKTNTYLKASFTDRYDPASPNAGTLYRGFITTNAPTLSAAYTNNMRLVTVTLFWTNYPKNTAYQIVRKRQMQTHVARYGMQPYIYQ